MKTNKRLLKQFVLFLLIGASGVLLGARSVYDLYSRYDGSDSWNREFQCTVPAGQTVVEWKKSTSQRRCRYSLEDVCVWPISHAHQTYKVTVNDGIPLRTQWGKVIPAINAETRRNWVTYDATAWNSLENNRDGRYHYTDYEPIASNEYVVMVETRYRLFNDVDSTLGICIQQ